MYAADDKMNSSLDAARMLCKGKLWISVVFQRLAGFARDENGFVRGMAIPVRVGAAIYGQNVGWRQSWAFFGMRVSVIEILLRLGLGSAKG